MSSSFLLQYFGDRHILLKDEWLNTCIDFLHDKIPRLSDEKLAELVLDQWTCSNIEETSFPVFGNHGIDGNTQKQRLQGPIVCQVNGFIDVGSPYYQQFCNLSGNNRNKEDNSGFEKVFHEKEEDSDQKPSRLLKLSLTDGESSLTAIEFWKCPQISLHLRPGTKILIEPPCDIRRGVFLLKPGNCKILGGEVSRLFKQYLPLEQYARILKIKDFKSSENAPRRSLTQPVQSAAPIVDRRSTGPPLNTPTTTHSQVIQPAITPRSVSSGPPVPSAMISRYLTKKPTICTPSTSKPPPEPREISPDILDETSIEDSDFEDENLDFSQNSTRKVSVSLHLSRIPEDFSPKPIKRVSIKSAPPPPPPDPSRRNSGMLTSRRVDPMDELLENMIEEGEEPVDYPSTSKNPFRTPPQQPPPLKKVKVENEDSDDDIQIIELTPPQKRKVQQTTAKEIPAPKVEKEPSPEDTLTPDERAALRAYFSLKVSSLSESMRKMRFSVNSKRFHVLCLVEDIADPLRVVDGLWTMKVKLRDSVSDGEAFIDNQTLHSLIGYSCEEAMAIRKSADLEKRKDGKRRLEALEQQLQRLDLVFEIEFFPGQSPSCPVIRSIKTLAEQLDVY